MGDITLPSVHVSKRLWFYLKKIQEKKMFPTMTELIRDALREYVERHHELFSTEEFKMLDAIIILEEDKDIEERMEQHLFNLADRLREQQ